MKGPAFCACGIFAFEAEAEIVPWNFQNFSEEYKYSER
jgi:hypothetical protein